MKVVNLFYFYDERITDERALIRHYYTTTGWAEALLQQGIRSILVTRFGRDAAYEQNGVDHLFIKDGRGGSFRNWQVPLKFLWQVKQLDADVIHVHSLTRSLSTFLLRLLLPRKTAIIVQHHGGPAPARWKRALHNLLNSVADAFFFTTQEQGAVWLMRTTPYHKVLPVLEGATFFNYDRRDKDQPPVYDNRALARQQTGLQGNPVWLWVGRLDHNKDPLTVLEGFAQWIRRYPQATLYMIYSDALLEPAVVQRIDQDPLLTRQVRLLGFVAHESIASYYQSADYFVLGSHYEGSGYALSEALRCGCVPVVTDIPSFRMMTDEGRLGALWQAGDANSLVLAAGQAMRAPLQEAGARCIAFWQQHCSFEAIARVAAIHYRQVVATRQPVRRTLPATR